MCNLSITWDPLQPLWDPFWSHFCNLGMTFGALWLHVFSKKTDWGARGATRGAKVEFPNIRAPIWTPFVSLLPKISDFVHEIIMCVHCLFKALCWLSCWCVFEQVDTVKSIENIAQASNNSVCRKSKKLVQGQVWDGFGTHFGGQFCDKCVLCCNNECKKTDRTKRYPKK